MLLNFTFNFLYLFDCFWLIFWRLQRALISPTLLTFSCMLEFNPWGHVGEFSQEINQEVKNFVCAKRICHLSRWQGGPHTCRAHLSVRQKFHVPSAWNTFSSRSTTLMGFVKSTLLLLFYWTVSSLFSPFNSLLLCLDNFCRRASSSRRWKQYQWDQCDQWHWVVV